MIKTLEKLCSITGVSGNEAEIRNYIIDEVKSLVDEIKVDNMGNLICIKKGSGKKIMFAAHMDEIGIIVTHIDENGFLRFSNMGGLYTFYTLTKRLKFSNGTVGCVFYDGKVDDIRNVKLSSMFIDIGVKSREEAEKLVSIGDTACFAGEFQQCGNKVISKAMDNRSGCAVLVEALKRLKDTETSNEIYFVFTVQEELGLRGAKTAAFGLMPDLAIAVDVTLTGDTPDSKPMEVSLGKGPAVKIKDLSIISHPIVKKLIVDTAKRLSIPLQYEILDRGGNDSGAIQSTAGGIPSGTISIPCRYVHSTNEMVDINDLDNAVKLTLGCIEGA
jgi:tetrahedral aminopeptidase